VKGLYATLSYCWGGPQAFSTTLDTATKYASGFTISELPKTLQDAVEITKRLGLEYIWIDSLCIIQDSPSDKNHEIPRMALYYKNSYVTICASRDSCQETFLDVRDECALHPGSGVAKDLLNLPFVLPDGGVQNIYFREESPYYLSWEPISKRAWTLQERILSPRVLIFGARTIWQCNSAQHSDGGNEDWSKDTRGSTHERLQLDMTDSTQVQDSDSTAHATKSLYNIWYRAIHEFASRKLSFEEDKLPAVAGLAVEFSNLSGDSFLAGLWRSQLPRELLWSTYPELNLMKPSTYRAPSWSWASVDNDITFDRMPPSDATCLAKIIECSVTPKSSLSPFGEIKSGTLEIEAPLLELGKDNIEKFMKNQYMVPAPQGKDYNWHRLLLNLMRRDEPAGRPDKGEWGVPDGTLLLALFASEIPGPPQEPVLEKGSTEMTSTQEPENEVNLKVNDEQENDTGKRIAENEALLYGLVVAPLGTGTYERIGAFTELRASGAWNAPSNRSQVKIV
jgi:Heterokaryon incompatibility protein (HET)